MNEGPFHTVTKLWGGPKDGHEVRVQPGQLQVFLDIPLEVQSAFGALTETFKARYQYNSMTKRFEWMGYE